MFLVKFFITIFFITEMADESLGFRVRHQVFFEISFLCEPEVASLVVANKWFFWGVYIDVI